MRTRSNWTHSTSLGGWANDISVTILDFSPGKWIEQDDAICWGGVKVVQSCPTLRLYGLYSTWDFPGQNTGVGSLSLLQGIFPTQRSNPGLLHCRRTLYHLNHQRSPRILEWLAHPFSSRSSWCRNWTGVSFNAGRFFTSGATREDVATGALNSDVL